MKKRNSVPFFLETSSSACLRISQQTAEKWLCKKEEALIIKAATSQFVKKVGHSMVFGINFIHTSDIGNFQKQCN